MAKPRRRAYVGVNMQSSNQRLVLPCTLKHPEPSTGMRQLTIGSPKREKIEASVVCNRIDRKEGPFA